MFIRECVCCFGEQNVKNISPVAENGADTSRLHAKSVDTAGAKRACYGHGMAPYVWPRCGATLVLASDFLSASYFIRCFYRAARFDGHFH